MFRQVRNHFDNIRAMLVIGWQADRSVTLWYYVTAGLSAVAPVFIGILLNVLIDHLVVPPGTHIAVPAAAIAALAGYFALVSINNAVDHGLHIQYFDYLFRYRLQDACAYRFCEKLTQLDVAHLEDPNIQNLITKVRDTHQWRVPDFLRMLGYTFSALVTYLAAAIALVQFGWWIVDVVTLVAIPRLVMRARFGDLQWSMYGSGAPEARKLWYLSWLLSESSSLREMKIFQSAPILLGRLRSLQTRIFALGTEPLRRYRTVSVIAPLAEGGVVLGLAAMSLHEVTGGAMTVGRYVFFVTMLQQLLSAAASVGANLGSLHENGLYVASFRSLLALPRVIEPPINGVRFPLAPPRIEFDDVGFAYPNGHAVLDHVSFVIEPGESVALVGINGAGKSTIIKLLCRFYDVTSGRILINGVDIRDVDLDNWCAHLGTLFQDFVQYHLSVRDNILMGHANSDDARRIESAADKAGAGAFIRKLPGGFDQMLGTEFEDGEQLSGGQWQKLAIARAFYQAPPVLVMDEPTSAIDAEAEYEIFTNLEREYREKTLILVSHRFSTVRNADRILVIDNGRLTESGTHEDLVLAGTKYAAMFEAQASGYR